MSQLAIYGLALSYPDKLRVEVKPKSGRDRGKIALISGEKTAGGHNVVLIQWEQRRVDKKKNSDLDAKIKSDYRFLSRRKDVDDISIHEDRNIQISGHTACYRSSTVQRNMSILFIKKVQPMQLISVHLYCEQSNRFITFFWSSLVEMQEMPRLVADIAQSLKCH